MLIRVVLPHTESRKAYCNSEQHISFPPAKIQYNGEIN